jgi:hypothetical protein
MIHMSMHTRAMATNATGDEYVQFKEHNSGSEDSDDEWLTGPKKKKSSCCCACF